ncbi:MAG: hypothetical protein QGD96_13515, partial [Anaerolineae bacterium]|nr:hypothetical protein [Anaerolineae bacterium]
EAIFVDEIKAAAKKNPRLHAHIRSSAVDGSLRAEHIIDSAGGDVRNHDIYMCGPIRMVEAFQRSFKTHGVPDGNIHYEEFNFR